VLARMAERALSGRRTPRRYVLSGLLRCGRLLPYSPAPECGSTV
jgi:hypothetical protein